MSNSGSTDHDVADLVQFIRFSLKEGISIEQIKESLLESGQSEVRIRLALEQVLKPTVPSKPPSRLPDVADSATPLLFPEEYESRPRSQEKKGRGAGLDSSEPKIELMFSPRRGAAPAPKPRRPRGEMSDLELIGAYKSALKKKAQKQKGIQRLRSLFFAAAALFIGLLLFHFRER